MTRDEIVTELRCCASPEVYCKGNCAFFGMSSTNNDCSQKKNTGAPLRRKPDDFCSYGDRKEGADNG